MSSDRRDLQAAPPDDGGHQGAFTKPDEVLQVSDDLDRPKPERRRDPVQPPAANRATPMNPFTILVLIMGLFSALFLIWWQLF